MFYDIVEKMYDIAEVLYGIAEMMYDITEMLHVFVAKYSYLYYNIFVCIVFHLTNRVII